VADHALVEKDAQPEDVRAPVDVAAFDLLRGHVRGAAEHLPRRRHALRIEELRDAEVRELHRDALAIACARSRRRLALISARGRLRDPGDRRGDGRGPLREPAVLARGRSAAQAVLDEDVLRLHVTMHDAARMRMRHPGEQLHDEGRPDLGRKRAALLEQLPQRGPANELDDEVLLRLLLRGDVEHLDDVRMSQLRDGLRLDGEAMRDLAALAEVGVEHLDRDVATEPLVVRAVDGGHASMTELVEHLVLGQDRGATRPAPGARHHRR
jgi:hypothetical protein